MLKKTEFSFRNSDRVGFAAAEEDQAFLISCFIDNGQYDHLVKGDLRNHIVLGRTGAGKTALLGRISEKQSNIVNLDPEQLALNYLANSTILRFLMDLDVDIDLFFGLLWRHVIVVEVLRKRYKIRDAESKKHFFGIFSTLFQEEKFQKAIEYLDQWGSSFWLDTDERIKEVASTLEGHLKAEAGAHFPGLLSKIESGMSFTEEERREYSERFKSIISQVQFQELSNVIDLLAAILDDPQNVYFVLVDHLDERWVDNRYKTRLIRALLEASRRFLTVTNLRIIIALRFDLYDRVLSDTRSSQQQEEKIHSLALNIKWTESQLTELLDQRINRIIRKRYTTQRVSHKEILPTDIRVSGKKQETMRWIIDRTFMRPRDIIQFFNFAIAKAVDQPTITEDILLAAEGEYSRDRLNAIADEYIAAYPSLLDFVEILYGLPERFSLDSFDEMRLLETVQNALANSENKSDKLVDSARDFFGQQKSRETFLCDMFSIFYEAGIVGLQKAPGDPISWTFESRREFSRAEITPQTRAHIHAAFWRRLGTKGPD